MSQEEQQKKHVHPFISTLLLFIVIAVAISAVWLVLQQTPPVMPLSSNSPLPSPSYRSTRSITATPVSNIFDIYALTADNATQKVISFPYQNINTLQQSNPVIDEVGQVYFIDGTSIKTVSLLTQKVETIYKNTQKDREMEELTFTHPNTLSITLFDKTHNGGGGGSGTQYFITELNLLDKTTQTMGPLLNEVAYGMFIPLFQSSSGNVLINSGGDSCGGSTNISLYANNENKIIIKSGAGCNTGGDEFVGAVPEKNAILLAQRLPLLTPTLSEDQTYLSYTAYGNLYLQDVTTGTKTPVFNLGTIPDSISAFHFDEITHSAIIETKTDMFRLDPTNTHIANAIPINGFFVDNSTIASGNMYSTDTQNGNLEVIDLSTGRRKILPLTTYFGGSPAYLGMWHNQPLFYVSHKSDQ